MKDFRDSQVWEKAHRLTLLSYKMTAGFPREEIYGLTSQIRRCAAVGRRQHCRRMWKKRQRRVSTLLKYCHRIGK